MPTDYAYALLHSLTQILAPIGGAALAVIVFTACVRLLLHPLTRAAVRGEKARSRIAPQIAQLRAKHKDPLLLAQELSALHKAESISPFAGMLPMLAQIPFFIVLYQLFARPVIGGHENALLHQSLLGVPLGAHLTSGLWVFLVLLATMAAVAYLTSRRSARLMSLAPEPPQGVMARLIQVMPFLILVTAAVMPLAAGLYMLTTSAWTLGENVLLRRGVPASAS